MAIATLMTGSDLCRALGMDGKNVTKITITADRNLVRVITESVVEIGTLEPRLQEYDLVKKPGASE